MKYFLNYKAWSLHYAGINIMQGVRPTVGNLLNVVQDNIC